MDELQSYFLYFHANFIIILFSRSPSGKKSPSSLLHLDWPKYNPNLMMDGINHYMWLVSTEEWVLNFCFDSISTKTSDVLYRILGKGNDESIIDAIGFSRHHRWCSKINSSSRWSNFYRKQFVELYDARGIMKIHF